MLRTALICLASLMLYSCEYTYTPKKKGYPRVVLPTKSYRLFDKPGFPYSFEYPTYATIVRDTVFFDEPTENPYWINIDFPSLDGKIYISYKEINAQNKIGKLIDDAFTMTYKHSVRADAIKDRVYEEPANHKYAVFYDVKGNAATAKQFYITDSVKHFLRGALYFNARPNEDSLLLVNDFVEEDMEHMIETLRWK